jgi:hypothetical protein
MHLTDEASVAAMMAAVKETFGSLDLLVLNASGGMEHLDAELSQLRGELLGPRRFVAEVDDDVRPALGPLDLLVLNASGGMESGMGEDYALVLNRDAQLNVLRRRAPRRRALAAARRASRPAALCCGS